MNSRTLASTEVLIDTLTGLSTTWASLAENPQNLGGLLMGGRSKPVAPCYRVFAAMRTAELAAADTVTRRAIVAQHVEGNTANLDPPVVLWAGSETRAANLPFLRQTLPSPLSTAHRTIIRMSCSSCSLLRVSRRGSGRSAK